MHTPRFSGQPAKAGDLVFVRTPSRPMRTSCENVGTVFLFFLRCIARTKSEAKSPHIARTNWRGSRGAQRKAREHTKVLKGSLRLRRYQQETPHALQEANVPLLVPNRRGLLGFSGLAPHSGRSSVPFRRTCSGTEEFPSNYPSQKAGRHYSKGKIPLPKH